VIAWLTLLACPVDQETIIDLDGDGVVLADDCDDEDADVHPGADEVCDEIDNNCDGEIDEGLYADAWLDTDGDGYGGNGNAISVCGSKDGYVNQSGDCEDDDPAIHPGAEEVCNRIDDDCDGITDSADDVWYADADADGYGDDATGIQTCEPEAGWVNQAGDCNDADASIHAGAEEACNAVDDDCDGVADHGVSNRWHQDEDADGYGHPYIYEDTCLPQAGWVLDGTDCRPGDDQAYPGAEERCNAVDDSCDGTVDEGFDADGDGHFDTTCPSGDDCDDSDDQVYPGAPEFCESGADEDCDGEDPDCGFSGSYALDSDNDFLAENGHYGMGYMLESGADEDCDGEDPDCGFSGSYALDSDNDFLAENGHYGMGYMLESGDVNGDGYDDIFSAHYTAQGGMVVFGPYSGTFDATNQGTTHTSDGTAYSGPGRSIGMGDVDGDGLEDVGFGAPYGGTQGLVVVFGPADQDTALEDDYGAEFVGHQAIYAGHGCDIGDVTGDGVDDLVVGAYYTDEGGGFGSGAGYIKYGPVSGSYSLTEDAEGVIIGPDASSYLGRWVRAGGDHDGDGIGDILIAAPYASTGAPSGGTVYIVSGPAQGSVDVNTDAAGYVYSSSAASYLGEGRTFAQGDVNGDGLSDAVVGGYSYGGGAGIMSVVYGPGTGGTDVASGDIVITGSRGSYFGMGPSAGDLDNDGAAELLIGASAASGSAGEAYLFWSPAPGTYDRSDADATFEGDSADGAGSNTAMGDLDDNGNLDLLIGASTHAAGLEGGVYGMLTFY